MGVSQIIAGIDLEISKLQQARALLSGISTTPASSKAAAGRGRPKGSKNTAAESVTAAAAPVSRKRKLSPEGRKRIAEAMKRRWAERRKATAK